MKESYLAIDIGGTEIKYALIDDEMTILKHGIVPCMTDSMDHLLEPLLAIQKELHDQYGGVAVAMPGRIDTANGIAHTGGSYTFIHNEPMGKVLENIFKVPVTVANDGKCAANAELVSGALKGVSSGIVLVIGTGLGGGVIVNGQVWLGSTFGAGEFSVMPTNLEEFYHYHYQGNEYTPPVWARDYASSSLVKKYCEKKNIVDISTVNGRIFFDAYEAGDSDAEEIFHSFCEGIAAGIFSIQSVLDVEKVAIGGGISARDEVTEGIRSAVNYAFRNEPFLPFGKPEIVKCRYGNDANLLGALQFHLAKTQK